MAFFIGGTPTGTSESLASQAGFCEAKSNSRVAGGSSEYLPRKGRGDCEAVGSSVAWLIVLEWLFYSRVAGGSSEYLPRKGRDDCGAVGSSVAWHTSTRVNIYFYKICF